MNISANFDSGNIEVVKAENPSDIQLKIRKDTNSNFLQYFNFRVSGVQQESLTLKILNAGNTSYPMGWENYNAYASYDRKTWFLVNTQYDGKVLTINHEPQFSTVYYAYYPPFSYEQHLDLIAEAQVSPICNAETIGTTVEGRPIDMLTVGFPSKGKKKVWIIARQHPGESMAEWFMQGLLRRLLDEDDALSRKLLQKAVFYIIPNMNIDGSIHGNLRSNAAGANLNREWEKPSLEKSPEVYYTLKKMDEIGLDMNLDIHGDEELPYNFIAAAEGIPNYTKKIAQLEEIFISTWKRVSPDFQDKYGYEKDEPGQANMTICTSQIANRFKTLALTIEMPFKDNADLPDEIFGWSTKRSEQLGASMLHPILETLQIM